MALLRDMALDAVALMVWCMVIAAVAAVFAAWWAERDAPNVRAVDLINARLRDPIRWPRWERAYVPDSTMRSS